MIHRCVPAASVTPAPIAKRTSTNAKRIHVKMVGVALISSAITSVDAMAPVSMGSIVKAISMNVSLNESHVAIEASASIPEDHSSELHDSTASAETETNFLIHKLLTFQLQMR